MTQPVSAPGTTKTVELPEPGYPMLTKMISNAIFPEKEAKVMGCPHCAKPISIPVPSDKDKDEPIVWVLGEPHPFVPNANVMRMFVDRGGVEVYSVSADGRNGMRNVIPMASIRFIEEAMPLDVFIDELKAAEEDDDDEEEPVEPEEPTEPTDPPPPVPLSTQQQPS